MQRTTQCVTSRNDFKQAGGSETRLHRYLSDRFPILKDGKHDFDVVPMDRKVLDVAYKYAKDTKELDRIVQHLTEIGYGCKRNPAMLDVAMERFTGEHCKPFTWNRNFQKACEQAKIAFNPKKFRLQPDKVSTLREIKEAIPREDTHPGFQFLLTGMKKKGEYLEDGFEERLFNMQEEALARGTFDLPIMIGTRLQVSGAYTEEGEPQTSDKVKFKERLVNMVDIYQILSECPTSRPVQRLLAASDYYAGGKKPGDLHQVILRLRGKYSHWLSLDYSAYDQSIPSWLIKASFDVIKSWFVFRNDREKRLFDVIVNDFVNKSFVWKEGKLVRAYHGVPSGSMYTQIIDTIANWIMIQTYYNSKGREETVACNICGDDNLIFHHGWLDEADLCSYLTKNFGIVAHPDKCDRGTCKTDDPKYLSRTWRLRDVYRNPKVLVSKMLCPERFRDYKRNPQMDPILIFYSYFLCYDGGMREFFDMEKFKLDNGHTLRDCSIGNLVGVSGYLDYLVRYEGVSLSAQREKGE